MSSVQQRVMPDLSSERSLEFCKLQNSLIKAKQWRWMPLPHPHPPLSSHSLCHITNKRQPQPVCMIRQKQHYDLMHHLYVLFLTTCNLVYKKTLQQQLLRDPIIVDLYCSGTLGLWIHVKKYVLTGSGRHSPPFSQRTARGKHGAQTRESF